MSTTVATRFLAALTIVVVLGGCASTSSTMSSAMSVFE
jgi:hypothetical protein